jgi:hypothetical protein
MAFALPIFTKFADVQQHHMNISGAECHPNRIMLAAVSVEVSVRSSLARVTRRHTKCGCSHTTEPTTAMYFN